MNPYDIQVDKKAVLEILYQSDVRLTAQAFIKEIKSRFSISSFDAKKILRQLIDQQELSYHYLYGSTYVEKSFLKPVRVTDHFILTPPGFDTLPDSGCVKIIINPGISFGSGQHPTTRLCLAAIEFCFFEKHTADLYPCSFGVDIGTGSGVLAMAMCLSGLKTCMAYEIDPVSANEARENIKLNHLEKRISLFQNSMEKSLDIFSIVAANLRFPTLKTLCSTIWTSLKKQGIVILSGVRQWEKEELIFCYSKKGFKLAWQQDEKKWSGFVWIKK